jgi:hypothetical protein
MPTSDATRRQQSQHLAQVLALQQAIASAIAAIEKNDLRNLETSLATQETICHRLSANPCVPSSASGEDAAIDNADALLHKEMREAHIALAQLNRIYAALLKRARKSAQLMTVLYRNHVASPQRHTWSCEA